MSRWIFSCQSINSLAFIPLTVAASCLWVWIMSSSSFSLAVAMSPFYLETRTVARTAVGVRQAAAFIATGYPRTKARGRKYGLTVASSPGPLGSHHGASPDATVHSTSMTGAASHYKSMTLQSPWSGGSFGPCIRSPAGVRWSPPQPTPTDRRLSMPRRIPRYRSSKGSCSQCGKRNVKVWLYPFLGGIRARMCRDCLRLHVGDAKLRELGRFGFILVTPPLPPETPQPEQMTLAGTETER
jgi:hypothetical protein